MFLTRYAEIRSAGKGRARFSLYRMARGGPVALSCIVAVLAGAKPGVFDTLCRDQASTEGPCESAGTECEAVASASADSLCRREMGTAGEVAGKQAQVCVCLRLCVSVFFIATFLNCFVHECVRVLCVCLLVYKKKQKQKKYSTGKKCALRTR